MRGLLLTRGSALVATSRVYPGQKREALPLSVVASTRPPSCTAPTVALPKNFHDFAEDRQTKTVGDGTVHGLPACNQCDGMYLQPDCHTCHGHMLTQTGTAFFSISRTLNIIHFGLNSTKPRLSSHLQPHQPTSHILTNHSAYVVKHHTHLTQRKKHTATSHC